MVTEYVSVALEEALREPGHLLATLQRMTLHSVHLAGCGRARRKTRMTTFQKTNASSGSTEEAYTCCTPPRPLLWAGGARRRPQGRWQQTVVLGSGSPRNWHQSGAAVCRWWSACFISAMGDCGQKEKVRLPSDVAHRCRMTCAIPATFTSSEHAYVSLPGLDAKSPGPFGRHARETVNIPTLGGQVDVAVKRGCRPEL